MTKETAKQILRAIIPVHSARLDGDLGGGEVLWRPHTTGASLHGEDFSADDLEAISIWMRSEYDPTRE